MDNIYLIVAVLAGIPLLAVGGYLFLRSRQSGPREIDYKHFQCPHCKQRLRYQPKQAGHSGQCPRCKRSITFPR
jgi:hypothetical protein